jgi:HAD superfamily hydrolase (TIGR01484 family)
MRYRALACDYDGTLASGGRLAPDTAQALRRLKAGGRSAVLVTGRRLDDLERVCPELGLFDAVVAENGALEHDPATHETVPLAEALPQAFVQALRARGVEPLSVGRVIVATTQPHEATVLEVIRSLGLELQVIFNKGAVMVLPSGINKATGLEAALDRLRLSPHNTVAVGDAENDHALLARCECGVAVANALPTLKERADLVTGAAEGAGVAELIDRLLATDLAEVGARLARHDIPLGRASDGAAVALPAYGAGVLVAGTSGGGRSTVVAGLLERMAERQYQHCIIDPEGGFASYGGAVVLGDARRAPTTQEALDVLADPRRNLVVNLLGLSLEQRPPLFRELYLRLQEMRGRYARPHWIVLDEAHHLLPAELPEAGAPLVPDPQRSLVLITVQPEQIAAQVLAAVDVALAIGRDPDAALQAFTAGLGVPAPPAAVRGTAPLEPGEALVWWRKTGALPPLRVRTLPPRAERKRHVRK